MELNINTRLLKTDYSSLFGSLSSQSGGAGDISNLLSDYASIKNGSYGKLMNAYYGKKTSASSAANSVSSISTAKDTSKQLTAIEQSAESLKSATDKLLTTGSKSVFNKKEVTSKDENGESVTTEEYDKDAIYKSVSSFVDSYNSMMEKGVDSNTSSISGKINTLNGMTKSNKSSLEKIGITVGESGRLSIDEGDFKKSDMTSVKSLFNGTGSYAYRVSAQASWIDFAAGNEANKSNTYGASGSYSNTYSAGDIFGSYI